MSNLYGHRWQSTYGSGIKNGKLTEAAEDWRRGLKGITPQQIGKALEKCLDRGDAWPPSLPEFRRLCLGQHDDPHAINAAAYQTPECLSLPRPRPSREKARPFLHQMRAALNK